MFIYSLEKDHWHGGVGRVEEEEIGCKGVDCGYGRCLQTTQLSQPFCVCPQGKTGDKCAQDLTKVALKIGKSMGTGVYLNRVYTSVESSTNANFSLDFRTKEQEGVLWWEGAWTGDSSSRDFLVIFVKNGQIHVGIDLGKDSPSSASKFKAVQVKGKRVDNGEWHAIQMKRMKTRLLVEVDGVAKIQIVTTEGSQELDTNGLVYLGGKADLPTILPIRRPLEGCVRNVRLDQIPVDLIAHSLPIQRSLVKC
ncbi:unnamed protein product, partial [Mesorhabditis belari]|uniref:Laminin G domain-containing protein n=1 Tax=Mesorhabditis belari TaxID=2138241 RepID=A0AAF3J670_9BILA